MTAIMRYDVARQAVAEAKTFDDVKKLRTYADMAREYARHAQDRTMEAGRHRDTDTGGEALGRASEGD